MACTRREEAQRNSHEVPRSRAFVPWTPAARKATLEEALAEVSRRQVLLAEDDDDMRSLVAQALRGAGFHVIEARDGSDLVRHIDKLVLNPKEGAAVDLIVSDVRLPGRSGLNVLAGLRAADWATPVILMTAFGDSPLRSEALRLGAVTVLDKPFNMSELLAVVQASLSDWNTASA